MTFRPPLVTRIPSRPPLVSDGAGNPNLLLGTLKNADQPFGSPGKFRSYDWPVPKGAQFPNELRTWIQSLSQELYVKPADGKNYDWPNPKGPAFPVELRTWTQSKWLGQDTFYGLAGKPNFDWPNPALHTPPTFADQINLLGSTLAPVTTQPPFAQYDWPNTTQRAFGTYGIDQNILPLIPQPAQVIPADLGLGHRSMRSLAKYRNTKRKELRDAIAALYETPQAEAVAQIVRPFAASEAEFPLEAIDWKALRADVETVARIIDLYVEQENEAEDEMILFGL